MSPSFLKSLPYSVLHSCLLTRLYFLHLSYFPKLIQWLTKWIILVFKSYHNLRVRMNIWNVFAFFYNLWQVLYKMSGDGDGVLIDMNNLSKVRTVKLASFTLEQFRWMCMLSGCDYLPSIKGMGLVKAHKLLQRHKNLKQVCLNCLKNIKKLPSDC